MLALHVIDTILFIVGRYRNSLLPAHFRKTCALDERAIVIAVAREVLVAPTGTHDFELPSGDLDLHVHKERRKRGPPQDRGLLVCSEFAKMTKVALELCTL